MIIQLILNVFGRIEILLGLPKQFRVGNRETSEDGLFGQGDALDCAIAKIRQEEVGRQEEGKGGVRSLRENIEKATELLRTRIAL